MAPIAFRASRPPLLRDNPTHSLAQAMALQFDTSPAVFTNHNTISVDTITNLAFRILMAVLGFITIYQAAKLAALHAYRAGISLNFVRIDVKATADPCRQRFSSWQHP